MQMFSRNVSSGIVTGLDSSVTYSVTVAAITTEGTSGEVSEVVMVEPLPDDPEGMII